MGVVVKQLNKFINLEIKIMDMSFKYFDLDNRKLIHQW